MTRAVAAILLLLCGCAVLNEAPPAAPAIDLVANAADPIRAALDAAAAAFADGGAALAGRPAATAQAAAQLEYLADALPADPRWSGPATTIARELALARAEVRDALGIAETAAPAPVIASLLAAARAWRAGDQAAAARALPAPLFRPGGAASVARLAEPGPLPQAFNATSLVATLATRRDVEGNWYGSRTAEVATGGLTTGGVPRDAGY